MTSLFRSLLLAALLLPSAALASTTYTVMESVPGFESDTGSDLASYVVTVYKFGIWTVGIAALLMVVIGGIMHVTSAGNAASMAKAKGVIRDAVAGVLMALAGWLLLYEIDRDLVAVTLPDDPIYGDWGSTYTSDSSSSDSSGSSSSGSSSSGSASTDANAGKCKEVTSGPCETSNLQQYFGDNAARFSRICNHESGGNQNNASTTDITADGHVFSWGLFQINLTTNGYKVEGMDCTKAFKGTNYKAVVVDEALYNKCVTAIKKTENNIAAAQYLFSHGGWKHWNNNCA